jgi:hypothetical protein
MLWAPIAFAADYQKSGIELLLLYKNGSVSLGRWNGRKWIPDKNELMTFEPFLFQRIPDLPSEVSIQWHMSQQK